MVCMELMSIERLMTWRIPPLWASCNGKLGCRLGRVRKIYGCQSPTDSEIWHQLAPGPWGARLRSVGAEAQ
jgi:hypothetical protein